MTSVEFVIWMRGFMACHPQGHVLNERKSDLLRDTLGLVNGVPTPREQRTILSAPKPLLPEFDAGDVDFVLSQNTEPSK